MKQYLWLFLLSRLWRPQSGWSFLATIEGSPFRIIVRGPFLESQFLPVKSLLGRVITRNHFTVSAILGLLKPLKDLDA